MFLSSLAHMLWTDFRLSLFTKFVGYGRRVSITSGKEYKVYENEV